MSISNLPTDQEYLKQLMLQSWTPMPPEFIQLQRKRWHEAVDEMVDNGTLDEKNREIYLKSLLIHHNPTERFQGDVLQELKQLALSRLGNKQEILASVPVGILSTNELNAFAIKTPRGGVAIALYASIWLYLKICFYCVLAILLRKSDNPIGAHHSNETFMINLLQTVDAIRASAIIVMPISGEHSIADCVGDSSRPEEAVVSHIDSALMFILLHEYGHIWHGHLDTNLTRKKMRGTNSIDIYLTSQQQESEADRFAAQHIWGHDGVGGLESGARLLSVSMLFYILDLCETNGHSDLLGTHPPSLSRLKEIHSTYRELRGRTSWQQIEPAMKYLDYLFVNIWEYGREAGLIGTSNNE